MAKYALVTCEIFRQDLSVLVPAAKNSIDVFYMELALHSAGQEKMLKTLQDFIDGIDQSRYDAILLGYGLCSNGVCSLHASVPVVLARAHDCVTLFMGSKQMYREYFDTHKGTFFLSNAIMGTSLSDELLEGKRFDAETMRKQFLEKYDEEEAEYLLETLGDPLKKYERIAFVNNGLGDVKEKLARARKIAEDKNWAFDEVEGSTAILSGLLDGGWDPAVFLVIQPGEAVAQSFEGEEIVRAVPYPDAVPDAVAV